MARTFPGPVLGKPNQPKGYGHVQRTDATGLVFDTDIVSAQAAYTVTKNAGVEIETGSFVRYLRGIALKAYPVTSPPWRYCVIGPFRRTDYGVRRQFLPLRYTLARIPFPTKHDKG